MTLKPSSFTTLGTAGGPMPNPARAQPAHLVMHGDRPILVDCGEGAIGQIARAGMEFKDVHDVVLTHHHFDHIGSLFSLLGLNMMTQRRTPLNVYGPAGTKSIFDGLIAACDVPNDIGFGIPGQQLPHPRDFMNVVEVAPGDVLDLDGMKVSFCENTHYRPETEFGKDGYISLSVRFDLADRSIFFTGDTGECKAVEELAMGVDLLVGELMDVELTMNIVRKKNPHMPEEAIAKIGAHIGGHHLSAEQLGDLAAKVGAKHVVATHIPPGLATPATAPDYAARIAARFDGEVTISQDLQSY